MEKETKQQKEVIRCVHVFALNTDNTWTPKWTNGRLVHVVPRKTTELENVFDQDYQLQVTTAMSHGRVMTSVTTTMSHSTVTTSVTTAMSRGIVTTSVTTAGLSHSSSSSRVTYRYLLTYVLRNQMKHKRKQIAHHKQAHRELTKSESFVRLHVS